MTKISKLKYDTTYSVLGAVVKKCGARTHLARTMMLDELELLFESVPWDNAVKPDYIRAIVEDNCLGKRSGISRKLSAGHLKALYALESSNPLFLGLRYYWQRESDERRLLALLCAYTRDPLLKLTAPYILGLEEGETVSRENTEAFIKNLLPGRFSKATLSSTALNINATWTKSGHLLQGKKNKKRSKIKTTPAVVAYAVFLGALEGIRGSMLFDSHYTALMDSTPEQNIETATEAARKGWLILKRVDDVIEASFQNIMNPVENREVKINPLITNGEET